ncbi:fumarylacetoacetate hydrolase family protein [Sulfoacidibacillus thermotolerans]|uniref:2-hydroxyhepta-2,4-diene-1,7-dioate isomerase n=1 Tax=Sulfoacidibacillus thermotolerans TaxID=1765684 RepID=A0A2U3D865_SULT2|nr:fumarylacetoacetate hydrolase family protein [Sulfoacidibacillus thermotolerans]PWI57484.1 2-hydroxyhepta-2,4-diene-1,7-dioate isomerase [Sulfoacidibacillus thermotolerans]
MKHVRYLYAGRVHHGTVVENDLLLDESSQPVDVSQITFLPPVVPGNVIGLALNYADHAQELGLEQPKEPVLFLKSPNTFIGHQSPVVYPKGIDYMHYECELAVVIGRSCRHVKREQAMEFIKGYTIANDVTVRDYVGNLYRPPIRAKGFDSFGPMGPYLVDRDDLSDVNNLKLQTFVNGELRQEGNTRDLIFRIDELIEFITSFMTLHENDMIWTGTPKGVSHVYPGDVMTLSIEGIGQLENRIIAE